MEFKKWLAAKGFGDVKDLSAEVKASLEVMYKEELKAKKSSEKESLESEGALADIKAQRSEMTRVSGSKSIIAGREDIQELQDTAIEKGLSVDSVKASVASVEKIRAARPGPSIQMGSGTSQDGSIEAAFHAPNRSRVGCGG